MNIASRINEVVTAVGVQAEQALTEIDKVIAQADGSLREIGEERARASAIRDRLRRFIYGEGVRELAEGVRD